MFEIGQRHLERRRQMRVGLVVASQPSVQFAQRYVGAPMVVERQARLEVRLRLAPQAFPLAQLAERIQQRGILAVLQQPMLRRLELSCRFGRPALGVQRREMRVPFPVETADDDFRRLAIAAQREKAGGSGARDSRIVLVRVGQAIPVGAQARRVLPQCAQCLRVGAGAHEVSLRGVVHLALDQLIDERRDFGVAPCRGERPQLEPQRCRMQARLAFELAQPCQRFARLSPLQRRFRREH